MTETLNEKVTNELKNDLKNRIYPEGTFIPSEAKLQIKYGCSRHTIRRALKNLKDAGLVTSIKGKGYYVVNKQDLGISILDKYNLLYNRLKYDEDYVRNVESFEIITITEEHAKKTGFPVGDQAYEIIRSRSVHDKIIIYETSYYLVDRVPKLTREIAEDSIYAYFRTKNFTDFKFTNIIFAEFVENTEVSLDPGENLVILHNQYTYDSMGNSIEFTESKINPHYFIFKTK